MSKNNEWCVNKKLDYGFIVLAIYYIPHSERIRHTHPMNNNIDYRLFTTLHSILNKKDLKLYRQLLDNNNKSFEELQSDQNENLQKIVHYSYEQVPFYRKQFKQLGIVPTDIRTVKDLELLPVIDKSVIRSNYPDFTATGYTGKSYGGATGGSTGEPLRYRIGDHDRALGFALSYRGWNYGGYTPGAPLLVLGGGSIVSKNLTWRKKMYHKLKNHHIASSYGMDDDYMNFLTHLIKRKKINHIRGYSSALFLLANWIHNNNIPRERIHSLKTVFTTSEMLFPRQRKFIEEVLMVKVYDGYGLNDGGVSAFENGLKEGFLIDTERAVMECVDESCKQVTDKPGRIIATSLFNYPMPFLRYDTGDIGQISDDYIHQGGNRYLLKNLLGRTNDFLEVNGKKIGSAALTVLMAKTFARRYQFIQTSPDCIEINIDKDEQYGYNDEALIKESLFNHVGTCDIRFNYGGNFQNSGNKYKFIIRKI